MSAVYALSWSSVIEALTAEPVLTLFVESLKYQKRPMSAQPSSCTPKEIRGE